MSHAHPRSHLDVLRAAEAAARQLDAARAAAYHVLPQGTSCKADWQGWGDPGYHATARQQALLDVVQDLLDGGVSEASDIALQAALRLRCTAEDLRRSRDNVDAGGESGHFVDDVLHALFVLDAQETEEIFYGLMDRLLQPTAVHTCTGPRPR